MSEKKRLTLTDLIKNKEQLSLKSDVTEELYIERLDATITIKKPERSLCLEAFEMANDENQKYDADPFVVYNTVIEPNLKDSELQNAYGCVEPTEIVGKIFEPGEIAMIAKYSLDLAGYGNSVGKVKDLKN